MTTITTSSRTTFSDIQSAIASVSLGRDYRGCQCRLGRQLTGYELAHVLAGGMAYLPVVAGETNVIEVATLFVDGGKRQAYLRVTGESYSRQSF